MSTNRILRPLLLAASLLSFSAPAFAACDQNVDAPCVTRTAINWSHQLSMSDRGRRVQVQTWGWVWNPEYGEWQWQAIVEERVSRDQQSNESYSEVQTETVYQGWGGWYWGW